VCLLVGGGSVFASSTANALPSTCTFKTVSTRYVLQADCSPTAPVVVPNGLKLDGQGYTMTFSGPWNTNLITNAGPLATVQSVRIDASGVACDTSSFAVVGFDNTSGVIKNTTIILPADTETCEINGITVSASSGVARTVDISDNVISNVTDLGILVNPNVASLITDNWISGTMTAPANSGGIGGVGAGLKRFRNNHITHVGNATGVESTTNADISNNSFVDCNNGVSIFSISGHVTSGTTVSGNSMVVQNNGAVLLVPGGGGSVLNTTVRANSIVQHDAGFTGMMPEQAGILVALFTPGTIDGVSITSNTLTGWTTPIDTTGATHVKSSGNKIN
jgi:hypothetical protein